MTRATFYKIMLTLVAAFAIASWPYLSTHTSELRHGLTALVHFTRHHNIIGYALFAGVFSIVLFLGLPFSTLIMLLSGILYHFWEATALVTLCRLAVAVLCFFLAGRIAEEQIAQSPFSHRRARNRHQQSWMDKLQSKFREREKLTLFLLRLSPLPDNLVNFSVNASTVRLHQYVAISLLGMIPFTFFYIWMGDKLGNITRLLHYIFS